MAHFTTEAEMDARKFSHMLQEAGRRLGTASAEFQCLLRSDRSHVPRIDPLLDLVASYDTSTFASGGVEFHPNPRDLGDRIEVGRYHGDLITMLKGSGSVILEEFGTNHHVLCPVAKSGDAFLDALLVSSIYLGRATLDETLYDDDTEKRQTAEQSASAAGGDEYQPFFRMLLGCE